MRTDWSQFKSFYDNRESDLLMIEDANYYSLYTSENSFDISCLIDKNASSTTELLDFETNYLPLCNPKKETITRSASPINEHCMEPWGCEKGYFQSKGAIEGDYVCAITLSNRSVDGLTFNYNDDCTIIPSIGNYVFQKESSRRSWITAINTVEKLVTFEMPYLLNGEGIYSKGYYLDVLVRNWKPLMYLWGLTLSVIEKDINDVVDTDPCGDFIELSVIDKDSVYPSEALIATGFEQSVEYGCITKWYDETWIVNCNKKYTPSPDGSPGELYPLLWLRLSFFTTENETKRYHIYADYYPTSKS